jgi:hypothetical protein
MYDEDAMFKAASELAALGLKIVRIYGLRDDLTCTCSAGADCSTPGKHPVGKNWGAAATDDEDEIGKWFQDVNDNVRWNVGIKLGAASGVIDVEADSEESLEVMRRFELDQIHTVAYRGSRGPHYLFRYEPDLPNAGVVKVDGLEVRIGGGMASTQSVCPPSQHGSGVVYGWLPGRSPAEAEIVALPPDFKAAVLRAVRGGGTGAIRQAKDKLAAGELVSQGDRHQFLLGWASELNRRNESFSEEERMKNFQLMACLNESRCDPPKGIEEVTKLNNDQFEHYRLAREERRGRRPLERLGLIYHEGEYQPGDWRLIVVHSDPKEYRLLVPNQTDRTKPWRVSLSIDDCDVPAAVAKKIMVASDINVRDPSPKRWNSVWCGYTVEDEEGRERDVQGLFAKLHSVATHEYPGGDVKAYVAFARTVMTFIDSYPEVYEHDSEDGKPPSNGLPRLIRGKDGQVILWFKWRNTLKSAHKVDSNRAEYCELRARDFKQRVLDHDAVVARTPGKREFVTKEVSGQIGRWTLWTETHMAAAREIADGA